MYTSKYTVLMCNDIDSFIMINYLFYFILFSFVFCLCEGVRSHGTRVIESTMWALGIEPRGKSLSTDSNFQSFVVVI